MTLPDDDSNSYDNEYDLPPPSDLVVASFMRQAEALVAEGFDPFDLLIGLNYVAVSLAVNAKETWTPDLEFTSSSEVIPPFDSFLEQSSADGPGGVATGEVEGLEGLEGKLFVFNSGLRPWARFWAKLRCCWLLLTQR